MRFLKIILALSSILLSTECLAEDAIQLSNHLNNRTGIACDQTAQHCVSVSFKLNNNAMDHLISITNDAGATWSEPTVLMHPDAEDAIKTTTNKQIIMRVACDATGRNCVLAGSTSIAGQATGLVYTTHDAGNTWSTPSLLPLLDNTDVNTTNPIGSSVALACGQSAQQCLLISSTRVDKGSVSRIYTTADGGQNWSPAPLPSTPEKATAGIQLNGVTCDTTGLQCKLIGSAVLSFNKIPYPSLQTPIVYKTQDGGLSWSEAYILSTEKEGQEASTMSLAVVACSDNGTQCTIIGNAYTQTQLLPYAYNSNDGGEHWTQATQFPLARKSKAVFNAIAALSCDSTGLRCAAVGFSVTPPALIQPLAYTTRNATQNWTPEPISESYNSNTWTDVFCNTSATLCQVTGAVLQ